MENLKELVITALESIMLEVDRTTTGNLAHHRASIKGICSSTLSMIEILKQENNIKNGERI